MNGKDVQILDCTISNLVRTYEFDAPRGYEFILSAPLTLSFIMVHGIITDLGMYITCYDCVVSIFLTYKKKESVEVYLVYRGSVTKLSPLLLPTRTNAWYKLCFRLPILINNGHILFVQWRGSFFYSMGNSER